MRIAFIIITTAILAACAPTGGGSGGATSTAWRGILSAGPASVDGSPRCGHLSVDDLACEPGFDAVRGRYFTACVKPGADTESGLRVQEAGGDWVAYDHDGVTPVKVGRTQGGVMTTAWCVRESVPVRHAWLGMVTDLTTGLDVESEQTCWRPDTGAAADCDAMGWPNRD